MMVRACIPLALASLFAVGPTLAQTAPSTAPVVVEPAAPAAPATKAGDKSGCMMDRHAMS